MLQKTYMYPVLCGQKTSSKQTNFASTFSVFKCICHFHLCFQFWIIIHRVANICNQTQLIWETSSACMDEDYAIN